MYFISQQALPRVKNSSKDRANFGLIFNKWLKYKEKNGLTKPTVTEDRKDLIEDFNKTCPVAKEVLRRHHLHQAAYCRAMSQSGWTTHVIHAKLASPFVSGLGMTHPTETGLVLDHTSGMPYIPASSQKGLLRLAHVIATLQDDDEEWLDEETLIRQGVLDEEKNWLGDQDSDVLFGTGGDSGGRAGQLVLLDAYPLNKPALIQEIINPHYKDYYEQKRGPSEDQAPVPIKFLALRPETEFVFRMLLRPPYQHLDRDKWNHLASLAQKHLTRSLTELGMGAKTALGFGRFTILGHREPDIITTWMEEEAQRQKEEQERQRQAKEYRLYPWRRILPSLESIDNWDALKTKVLHNVEFCSYQNEPEVGQAVLKQAMKVAKKKWNEERDQEVSNWLKHSGTEWQPQSRTSPPPDRGQAGTDSQLLEQIKNLSDDKASGWQEWTSLKVSIKKLDKECAQVLKEKFQRWGLKKSKEKNQKRVYNQLAKHIKNKK